MFNLLYAIDLWGTVTIDLKRFAGSVSFVYRQEFDRKNKFEIEQLTEEKEYKPNFMIDLFKSNECNLANDTQQWMEKFRLPLEKGNTMKYLNHAFALLDREETIHRKLLVHDE